jgi:hypothetical protein
VIGEIRVIALRTTRPRSSPARTRTDLQNLTHTTRAHFPSELPLDAREGGGDDARAATATRGMVESGIGAGATIIVIPVIATTALAGRR